ncbi:MAG: hypothetical protein MHM6MM_001962 [Cercozoa sp. M6MM]
MRPGAARRLLKDLLWASQRAERSHAMRRRIKDEFRKLRDCTDEEKLRTAFMRGRWFCRELEQATSLGRYRKIRRMYGDSRDHIEQSTSNSPPKSPE